WEASGAVWTPERAYKLYEQILHEFAEPLIDQGIKEELKEFVDRRKVEGGAPTDF
ncbi:MAG TPA: methyltransferase, partial [Flavobacteriales bacterium]|nr:methyltransferase [Flavobacteriales bacterium]